MFPGQPWYHPTEQLHHGFLRKAVGDFVTPFVLEKLFDFSCSVQHVGSYNGHAPTSSGKFVYDLVPSTNQLWEEIDLLGCCPCIGYHWFVCLMGLQFLHGQDPSSSDLGLDNYFRVVLILSMLCIPMQKLGFPASHYGQIQVKISDSKIWNIYQYTKYLYAFLLCIKKFHWRIE